MDAPVVQASESRNVVWGGAGFVCGFLFCHWLLIDGAPAGRLAAGGAGPGLMLTGAVVMLYPATPVPAARGAGGFRNALSPARAGFERMADPLRRPEPFLDLIDTRVPPAIPMLEAD